MIEVDTKKIDQMLFKLRRKMPDKIPDIIVSYVNSLAFNTKENTQRTLDQQFNFANNSTRNFTNKGVNYKPARKGSKDPESTVGAVGDPNATSLKARKAAYLARQEFGGTLTQIKSGGGIRSRLIAPNPKYNKKSRLFKIKGKAAFPNSGYSNTKRQMASAFSNARRLGKKWAHTPYGIYRVLKKSARLHYIYKPKGSIKNSPHPWLQPAINMTMARKDAIFRSRILRQIKKDLQAL